MINLLKKKLKNLFKKLIFKISSWELIYFDFPD